MPVRRRLAGMVLDWDGVGSRRDFWIEYVTGNTEGGLGRGCFRRVIRGVIREKL